MKQKIAKYSILVLIPILSIELLCFTFLWFTNGSASLPTTYISKYEKYKTEESDCSWSDYVTHHPYLMIQYKKTGKCTRYEINPAGMLGAGFKLYKEENFYNILLTGGSVAEGLHASGFLEKVLNKKYKSPTGMPIRVMNAAIAAGQQPRQAIANLMYGELADVVISLEGFNELYNLYSLFPFNTASMSWYQLEEILLRAKENRVNSFVLRLIFAEFAAIIKSSVLKNTFCGASIIQIASNMTKLSKAELEPKMVLDDVQNYDAYEQRYFEKYVDSIRSMSATSNQRNQKLIIFIQPIPEIDKELTEREKTNIEKRPIKKKYLKLISALSTIDIPNLYIKSLTDIFKDYKGELYSDDIHYIVDSPGEKILADSMANYIAQVLNFKKKQ